MLGNRDKMRENLLAIRGDYWSNHITTHAKRLPQEKRTAAVSAVRRMAAILAGCSPLEKAVLLYRMYTYNITYVNPMGYKHNSLKFNCKLEKNA